VNEKRNYRVFTVFAFLGWDGGVALVIILLDFHCTKVHPHSRLKISLDKLAFLAKPETRFRNKIRALKLLAN